MLPKSIKQGLAAFWKFIPPGWRWRLLWGISDKFLIGVTGVVLNARDEVLLAHHVYRSGIEWGLPGGGVQRGESLERATRREILEETGLAVAVRHLLQVTLDQRHPVLNCHFWCSVEGTPRPQPNHELLDAGFYTLDALPGVVERSQQTLIAQAIRIKSGAAPSLVVLANHGQLFEDIL